MRAPRRTTADEIGSQHEQRLRKVDYYYSKYASLRQGIRPHSVRVDSLSMLAEFLSINPIDYGFVCIDQLTDSDWPPQDVVYAALSDARIPFIDSGVRHYSGGRVVSGAVTTERLPCRFARVEECHTERQSRGRCARLPQRAAARGECVGSGACGDGVAAADWAVCFEIHFISLTSSESKSRTLRADPWRSDAAEAPPPCSSKYCPISKRSQLVRYGSASSTGQ